MPFQGPLLWETITEGTRNTSVSQSNRRGSTGMQEEKFLLQLVPHTKEQGGNGIQFWIWEDSTFSYTILNANCHISLHNSISRATRLVCSLWPSGSLLPYFHSSGTQKMLKFPDRTVQYTTVSSETLLSLFITKDAVFSKVLTVVAVHIRNQC